MTSDSEVNNYCDTGPSLRSILVEIDIYNNKPTYTYNAQMDSTRK